MAAEENWIIARPLAEKTLAFLYQKYPISTSPA